MNAPTRTPAASGVKGRKDDQGAGPPLLSLESQALKDVRVTLSVRLGEAVMPLEEVLALRDGSVVPLDRLMSELVDLYLNDTLVARGHIVAVDDRFGVSIVEVDPVQ